MGADVEKARTWYRMAESFGSAEAKQRLRFLISIRLAFSGNGAGFSAENATTKKLVGRFNKVNGFMM